MKKLVLPLLLSSVAFVRAAAPAPALTVSDADPVVTETWTARIVLHLPPLEGRFAGTCPLKAPSASPFGSLFDDARTGLSLHGFPVPDVRFRSETDRVKIDKVDYWRVTLVSEPITAARAETIDVGPVTVEASLFDGQFVRGFFGAQPHTVVRRFTMPPVRVTVHEPPAAGRPASYTGAIGRNIAVASKLDADVCTAGDPLVLTVTVAGATDPARIRVPEFADALRKGGTFRLDSASVKSRVAEGGARVFTWRVRALKAGTVEFPPLEVGYFDAAARQYRTARTERIPIQVKAGAQVALGQAEGDESDEASFPMPDGLDLDFVHSGTADFTLDRAVSLACRAQTPADFAAAAAAYAAYLDQRPRDVRAPSTALTTLSRAEAAVCARHCANFGALSLLAGDARGAYRAYARMGEYVGETAACRRGLKAACARLANDPRADLPVTRILFPFWFRFALPIRAAGAALALFLVAGLWYLAGRLGRGGVLVLAVAAACLPQDAGAQFSRRFSFGGGAGASVKATVALVPAETVVDEPSALVFSFDVEGEAQVTDLRFGNLPDPAKALVAYGPAQPIADGTPSAKGRTTRRVRIPVRFCAPFSGTLQPVVEGMLTTSRGNGTSFSFTSSVNFSARCAPLALAVAPLPVAGRPDDFAGAVGRDFRLVRRLTPQRVHPGDLVTSDCTLSFDGWFPTNVLPKVTGLAGFKAYDLKEVARSETSVTWRQMLVPETVAATNAPTLALSYYDVAAKTYRTLQTPPAHLVFISRETATTANTAVLVDVPAAKVATGGAALVLRFAPSDASPAVATLAPGTDVRTTSVRGAWRRVEAPTAAGWVRETPSR